MTLSEAQDRLVEEITALGDAWDQYEYLILLAGRLPPLDESERTEEALVAGCQSRVWLVMEKRDGRFSLRADSGTLILRGVLYLLTDLLNGRPAAEVAAAKLDFLQRTEMTATFAAPRRQGLAAVLEKIRRFAAET